MGQRAIGRVRGKPLLDQRDRRDRISELKVPAGFCPVPGLWAAELLAAAIDGIEQGSFKVKQPPELRGSGYVIRSLDAALWAFQRWEDFCGGALLAIHRGNDTDTTGAVYGQLAGAFYGASSIPDEWRDVLALGDRNTGLAEHLMERVARRYR